MKSKEEIGLLALLKVKSQINLHNLYIYFLIGSAPVILTEDISNSSPLYILEIWSLKAAATALACLIWLAARNSLRNRIETTIRDLLLLGALGGAIGGWVVFWGSHILGFGREASLTERIIGAAIYGAVWLPALSTYNNALDKFTLRVSKLQNQLLLQHEIKLSQSKVFQFFTEATHQSLQYRLSVKALEAQAMLQAKLRDPNQGNSLPQIVHDIATSSFRNFSHSLAISQGGNKSSLKNEPPKSHILRDFFLSIPASIIYQKSRVSDPTKYSIVVSLFSAAALIRHQTFFDTILSCIAIFISIFSILWIHIKIEGQQIFANVYVVWSSIIFVASLPPLILKLASEVNGNFLENREYRDYALSYFVLAVVMSFLGLITNVIKISSREFEGLLRDRIIEGSISENLISREIARITKQWSLHIHGNLQGPLVILGAKLEKAELEGDLLSCSQYTDEILEILLNTGLKRTEIESDLEAEISKKCKPWSGLVEINIDFGINRHDFPLQVISLASDCVEEMIANAYRHGKASVVSIGILMPELGKLEITSSDNGHLRKRFSPGLGFSLFEDSSHGLWEIGRNKQDTQTVVKVIIAI